MILLCIEYAKSAPKLQFITIPVNKLNTRPLSLKTPSMDMRRCRILAETYLFLLF